MLANIVRDAPTMPVVDQMFSGFRAYLDAAQDTLMAGRRVRGAAARRVRAAAAHALDFTTWRSLVREHGLSDSQAADLMCRLVAAAP